MCVQGQQPSVFWQTTPTAKKQHSCCECLSVIPIGDKYELIKGVWEGKFNQYKTCSICSDVRDAATRELGDGIVLGRLWETVGTEFEEAATP